MSRIVCFGEVLWDVFPEYKNIGGAPLNVALRFRSLGNQVSMISSVGNDTNGQLILDYLEEKELNIDGIMINNEQPTSCVIVKLDVNGSATYTIEYPCAWDFIVANQISIELVKNSDVFIFGSLAARNKTSESALIEFLDHASYKVFDVNLRAPHYSYKTLESFIGKVDVVKFNDEEIEEISKAFGCESKELNKQVQFIAQRYNVETICVTLGSKGALIYKDNNFFKSKGYQVKVKDTVGAGDSFLAALVDQLFKGESAESSLSYACAIGSLVASKEGANPVINSDEILEIQTRKN